MVKDTQCAKWRLKQRYSDNCGAFNGGRCSIVRGNKNQLFSAAYASVRRCSTRYLVPCAQDGCRGLPRNPMLCSLLEMQLQRDLHGTRSAQLIDGTEPSELAGERCVRLAKQRPVVQ